MSNINVKAILSKLPNSNAKQEALSLLNAKKHNELIELVQTNPKLSNVMHALEKNDFSSSMENVPSNMLPNPNNMAKNGGKRARRTRHMLRKKRTLRKARKTRRHSRRA